jgi:threonine/homoserine/homoserine lactone efflux protein
MAISIIPLATFSFVGSITPGPNNLMLTSSGMNFGFRKTIPHFLGVYFGFLFMLGLVCLGFGIIFQTYPQLQDILRYLGSAYLVYLAYRIAMTGAVKSTGEAKPFNFLTAAMFQYVNPKAWMMAGTIASAFIIQGDNVYINAALAVGTHALVSFPCILTWVLFGTLIRRYLKSETHRKIFNYFMAGLLLLTTWFILMG